MGRPPPHTFMLSLSLAVYTQTHAFCVRFLYIHTQTHYLPHGWFRKRPLFIFFLLYIQLPPTDLAMFLEREFTTSRKMKGDSTLPRQFKETFTWPVNRAVRQPVPSLVSRTPAGSSLTSFKNLFPHSLGRTSLFSSEAGVHFRSPCIAALWRRSLHPRKASQASRKSL